jgi:predicted Zn-dependent protease
MLRKLLLTGCVLLLSACTTNPVTGRHQLALVPEEQVISASSQAYSTQMAEYQKKGELEANSPVVARVRNIASRIIEQASRTRPESANWKWEVNVIDEPQVNAFAMAGGKIAVYTGLLEKISPTDDELAQVMAHEVAHALAGHTREKMSVAMGTDLALAAYGATEAANEKVQQALAAGALLAIRLPNSRKMESEADRVGIELAAKAGYDPNAAVSLWRKMAQAGNRGGPEFLSTHPSDERRLQTLAELAPQMMPIYKTARR